MSIKNIAIASFMGGLLVVFVAAGFIVSGFFGAPAALVTLYVPDAIGELE